MTQPKIVAVFIAYNAASTFETFYAHFPKQLFDDIILVDDASRDNTYEIAKRLGVHAYRNKVNLGYGGNMKRAISIALNLGADVLVDIHPDGEYLPSCIPAALQKIAVGAELVLGNRFQTATSPLNSGMYIWKILPIWILNKLAQWGLQSKISDMHQGFRVYTREMLNKIAFENDSNNYLFSFELIAQAVYKKIPIAEVPVETHYSGEKRGASLKHSIIYTLGTLKVLGLFLLAKLGIKTKLFATPTATIAARTQPISSE